MKITVREISRWEGAAWYAGLWLAILWAFLALLTAVWQPGWLVWLKNVSLWLATLAVGAGLALWAAGLVMTELEYGADEALTRRLFKLAVKATIGLVVVLVAKWLLGLLARLVTSGGFLQGLFQVLAGLTGRLAWLAGLLALALLLLAWLAKDDSFSAKMEKLLGQGNADEAYIRSLWE